MIPRSNHQRDRHGRARKPILRPRQQKEARARIAAGVTQRSVARSYNVNQSTISRLGIDSLDKRQLT